MRPSQERLARKTPAPALNPTTGRPVDPDLDRAYTRARARLDALLRTYRRGPADLPHLTRQFLPPSANPPLGGFTADGPAQVRDLVFLYVQW
jgi:hypothetical protein